MKPKRGRPKGLKAGTVTLNCKLPPNVKAYLAPHYSQTIIRLVTAQPDFDTKPDTYPSNLT